LSTKRSLRLVLAEAGVEAALEAEEMTGLVSTILFFSKQRRIDYQRI